MRRGSFGRGPCEALYGDVTDKIRAQGSCLTLALYLETVNRGLRITRSPPSAHRHVLTGASGRGWSGQWDGPAAFNCCSWAIAIRPSPNSITSHRAPSE